MNKIIAAIVSVGLAVAFTAPAMAAKAPTTKAACEKAKMTWDDASKTCTKPKM